MELIEKIRIRLDAFDRAKMRNYLIFASVFVLLISACWIWFFYTTTSTIKRQIASLNNKRRTTSLLLARYALVKKQQAEVDEILAKHKDFKISQTFENLLETTGITANKAQEPETASAQVPGIEAYTEWTLHAQLNNISMKKLSELLYAIEQEERIYTKEVDIERNSSGRFVNAKIIIATLEPKSELPDTTER